jgi:hypothetical protein
MTYIIAVLGFVVLSLALWDSFEVIISPRARHASLSVLAGILSFELAAVVGGCPINR